MATPVMQRAKRPVTKLAGPYGHPFHPILVPLPIGAFVLAMAFDIASFFAGDAVMLVKMSFWCIGAGVVGALFAAVFGLFDLVAIPRGTKAFAVGMTHMALNLIVVGVYAVNFALRRGNLDMAPVAIAPLVLSAAALAMLGVSGWLGGELAYRFGVRVADEGVQAEGFEVSHAGGETDSPL